VETRQKAKGKSQKKEKTSGKKGFSRRIWYELRDKPIEV
jgi:hypothetical protein